jgi:DNA polymerase III subunit delta
LTDVKAHQAEAFLRKPPKGLTAVLFYGADPGQVSERATTFAKTLAAEPGNPGEILRINDADLGDDPDRLGVELRTISMFGGRRIVRLQAETRLRPDLLAGLLDSSPKLEGFLIVEAGDLKSDSKVKALFVEATTAAAVACSGDDDDALSSMLDTMLAQSVSQIEPDARAALLALLGADRTLSRAEIDKLLIYAGPATTIREADVAAIVGDAAELALDDVVAATFSGQAGEALRQCDRALGSGETAQSLLLALQRHVLRLAQARSLLDQGRSMDAVFRGMRPPLFGKARDALTGQLRTWSGGKTERAVAGVQAAIAASRQTGAPDRELCEQLLLQLATLAQR